MKGANEVKISYWAAHLTTIVSVTLVLLLVGLIALITLSSDRETRKIKERLEVSLIMNDTVSDGYAAKIEKYISDRPYAIESGMISKDQAIRDWQVETGENLEELFGVNPLSPEVFFRLKAEYSASDSIKKISSTLENLPGVAEVVMPDSELVKIMNENIQSLTIILGIVATVMIVISFILINNTVHLSIYSRRFTIHTMQLVGATDGFIRRPFLLNNMLSGLISGLMAAAITAISLAAAPHLGWNDVADYISWGLFACVGIGMVVVGVIICGIAAWFSTSKYLSKEYDELFM